MTTSVGREAWEDFARIAGVELAVIDENTTARQFEKELEAVRDCTTVSTTSTRLASVYRLSSGSTYLRAPSPSDGGLRTRQSALASQHR